MAYNLKPPAHAAPESAPDLYSEFDSPSTIDAIAGALRARGHAVSLVEADDRFPDWIRDHRVDLVFNIAEGRRGAHRESQIPAILESLDVPFTGSSSLTLALALDKAKTKLILAAEGLPTPPWQLFRAGGEPLNPALRFPLIVKPNREGSAKGLTRESLVHDEPSLRGQIRRVIAHYGQAALVEEFIDGLELTVGVLGNAQPQALPILEIDLASCEAAGEPFYSWRVKEYQGKQAGCDPRFHCPARLDARTTQAIQAIAVQAHRALGCRELSRTDIRLRKDGVPFVLEINPLPGLDPVDSNLTAITNAVGMPYHELINEIVDLAWERYEH